MSQIKAKKHLGQHFLKNEAIAEQIATSLDKSLPKYILEIGPGMGVLTKYFLDVFRWCFNARIRSAIDGSVYFLGCPFPHPRRSS